MKQSIRPNKSEGAAIALMNYKDDERLLSESLYRNLHVMQRFHSPSPEFISICEEHMFVKSNPNALLHVTHFIFNCLDVAEFNKRFLWPLFDKASEARYRKSTLEYMNHLNVVHDLGLETLKLHILQIPGGLKFIKIIHKFSVLVMKTQLSKYPGDLPNVNEIPDADEQLAKLEQVVDAGLGYVARLEAQSDILGQRIDEMNETMVSFFEGSSIKATKDSCWSCLAKEWRDLQDAAVESELKPQFELVAMVDKSAADLSEVLKKFFGNRKKNNIEFDKAKLAIAQNALVKMHPDQQQAILGIVQNNAVNFENLLQVFHLVLPMTMEKINNFEYRPVEAIQYEFDKVDSLDERASQLLTEMQNFEQTLEPFRMMDEERFRTFYSNIPPILPLQVMQTPIIIRKCDAMRRRIAFTDDSYNRSNLFNETMASKSRTIRQERNFNATTIKAYSSVTKRRNDAMQAFSKTKSKDNATLSISTMSGSPKFSSTMCSAAFKNHQKFSPPLFSMNTARTERDSFLSPKPNTIRMHWLSPNASPLRGSPTRRWEVNDDSAVQVPVTSITHSSPLNGNRVNPVECSVKKVLTEFKDIDIDDTEFLDKVSDEILNDVSGAVPTLHCTYYNTNTATDDRLPAFGYFTSDMVVYDP